MAVQLVHADAGAPGPHRRRALVDPVGQPGEQVQPRGGAADAHLGEVPAQRADQEVALRAVAPAHRAQMAFERGVLDERGQRDLVDGRRRHAGDQELVFHVVDQVRGGNDPGEPQRGRQRLARRPDERDQIRCQALEGGHRLPAEAVFDVVVVL
ncbi:MAG TPA: hypothetical protein VF951_07470, partial [Streptosporangiaceae bacterium]